MTTSQTNSAASDAIVNYMSSMGMDIGPRMKSLTAPPTFKHSVRIPQHGGGTITLPCVFKHRTKDQLTEFLEEGAEGKRADDEFMLAILEGFELEGAAIRPATAESVAELMQHYQGAAEAIARAYVHELTHPGQAA